MGRIEGAVCRFDRRAGRVRGVIGSNGAGKPSLLRAIAGVVKPAAGRVTFDGGDATGLRVASPRKEGLDGCLPIIEGIVTLAIPLQTRNPAAPIRSATAAARNRPVQICRSPAFLLSEAIGASMPLRSSAAHCERRVASSLIALAPIARRLRAIGRESRRR
jgi:energy-coupling factor transporter ATP-binding protein EcfA2